MSNKIPAPPAPPSGPSDWADAVHGNSFTNLERLWQWTGYSNPVPLRSSPDKSFKPVAAGSLGGGGPVNIYVVAHGWAPGYRKAVQQNGGHLRWWDAAANVSAVWASYWAWSPFSAPLSPSFDISIGMLPSIVSWQPQSIVLAYSWIDESATGGSYSDKDEVYQSEAYTDTNGIRLANALEEAIAAPFWSTPGSRLRLIGHSHGSKVATVAALTLQRRGRKVAQLTILDAPESDTPLYANGANLLGFYLEQMEIADPSAGPDPGIVSGAFIDNYASYFGIGYAGSTRLQNVVEVALAPSQLFDRDDPGDQHSYAAAFYAGAAAGSRRQNEPLLGFAWPPPPQIYQPALNQGWPTGTNQKSQWSLQPGNSILGTYSYSTQPLAVTAVSAQGNVSGDPASGLRFGSAGTWPAYSIFSGTYPNHFYDDGYGIAFDVYWTAPQPGDYLVVTAESPEEHEQEVLLVMDGVSAPRGLNPVAINIDVSGTVPFNIYYLAAAGNLNGQVTVSNFRLVSVKTADGHLRAHRLERAAARSNSHLMATQEQNKEIVRQYVDAFNQGDLEALRALFAEEAEIQGVFGKGLMDRVLPVWRQLVEGYGMQLTVEDMAAEGDVVAVRYTERGTFRAPAFGKEPTGKSYELVAMEWFVIRDGKIQRRWGARDSASQARQLGLPIE